MIVEFCQNSMHVWCQEYILILGIDRQEAEQSTTTSMFPVEVVVTDHDHIQHHILTMIEDEIVMCFVCNNERLFDCRARIAHTFYVL